jgi:hypothetical protein
MARRLILSTSYAVRQLSLLSYSAISSFLHAGQITSSEVFLLQRLQIFLGFSGTNGFMKNWFVQHYT